MPDYDHFVIDENKPKKQTLIKVECGHCHRKYPRAGQTVDWRIDDLQIQIFFCNAIIKTKKRVDFPLCQVCMENLNRCSDCGFLIDKESETGVKTRVFTKVCFFCALHYSSCNRCGIDMHKTASGLCKNCHWIDRNKVISDEFSMTSGISRYFGIEFELANCAHNTESQLVPPLIRSFFFIGCDGSIRPRDTGREVRTKVMQGNTGFAMVETFLTGIQNRATVNTSTGLHVHVDATDLTMPEFYNVISFMRLFDKTFFSLVDLSRNGNEYCQVLPPEFYRLEFPVEEDFDPFALFRTRGKYNGFNAMSFFEKGSFEFRYHHGTMDYEAVKHWVQLCLATIEHSRKKTWRPEDGMAKNDRGKLLKMLKSIHVPKKQRKYWVERQDQIKKGVRYVKRPTEARD